MNEIKSGQHETRTVQPSAPESVADRSPLRPSRAVAVGAVAFGALALGATAIGALAIGRLAVGAFVLRRGHVRFLVVDDLEVRRLHIREFAVEGGMPR